MTPSDWKDTTLGEITTFKSGGTPSKQNEAFWGGQHPWISAKDLKKHYLSTSIDTLTGKGFAEAKRAPTGSSLVLVRGMTLLKDFPVGYASRELAFNQDIKALVPKPGIEPLYLSYLLVSKKDILLQNVSVAGHGTGKLETDVLKELAVVIPPAAEQTKIAQILSTWDKAIATTERLLANSQQQKQALLGPLLSGQKRFAGYPEWVNTPIAKLLTESRLPGSNGEVAKKITVKLYGNGVVAKDEKRIGSESTKYYTRKAGQFIYSKLDFLNGAFGIIPEHLDGYESTLDLPAFNFTEYVEPAWLVQYISREEFYSAQLGLANGGRKARRVNPADLLNIEIPLPSRAEQQRIAQVLSTADAEIANLQAQLAALKLEKKALMQQLLTGQRRVKPDADAAA